LYQFSFLKNVSHKATDPLPEKIENITNGNPIISKYHHAPNNEQQQQQWEAEWF